MFGRDQRERRRLEVKRETVRKIEVLGATELDRVAGGTKRKTQMAAFDTAGS